MDGQFASTGKILLARSDVAWKSGPLATEDFTLLSSELKKKRGMPTRHVE